MTTATEEGDLMESKAPKRVQEGRLARAATMATYLRSALGRAGEKLTTGGVATHVADEEDEENGRDNQGQEDGEQCSKVVNSGEEMESGECETASSSGRTEEILERQDEDAKENATETFVLNLDTPKSGVVTEIRAVDVIARRKRSRVYCDVLLQPDAHGLGLNLSVAAQPEGFPPRPTGDDGGVVTVSSFRRLHGGDAGPAEVSGQVHVGDILYSINGYEARTLEAVANILSPAIQGGSRPFVLLRFLRQSDETKTNTAVAEASPAITSQASANSSDDLWTTRPDVAMLIRELVVKNQSLEEQILASRLKQDEQRIQLEQLHTLYAKTQLENWSGFSLPKPRAPFNMTRGSEASAKGNSSLSTAAARLIGVVNPAQYDVEFAVNAERERLTRQFEQRLEMERRQLQSQHEATVQTIQAAAGKKIRMLEFGVKQLLQTPTTASHEATPVEPSAHVQILRHQLLHRKPQGSEELGEHTKHNCALCLVVSEIDKAGAEITGCFTETDTFRTQMLQILDEYGALKTARKAELMEKENPSQQTVTSNQEEDTTPATVVPDSSN